jgi:hypothetical protein
MELRHDVRTCDILVAGAGMAGIGAALTAARHGARVLLVGDRPVLGGNASKEVRVNLEGASGGANALYWRETGLVERILLDNLRSNPEGNAEAWNLTLLEAVLSQPGLELMLNTTVHAVEASGHHVASVTALTVGSEIETKIHAAFFIDCTGDGTLAYLAGAPYMTGRESKADFGEALAPDERSAGTMGTSAYLVAKDVGHPVAFRAPSFAHKFTETDFRPGRDPVREFDRRRAGFWWMEYGGHLDTIHDNEAINFEIQRIALGIFDYLKNSPKEKDKNANLALEFVSCVGGRRESRRFVGEHVTTADDVIGRPALPDAVAYGGWNMDDHAPKGFFDDHAPPSFHRQIPGIYNVPLRSLYSKTIDNLFFAGRNASVTHLALSTTRVMLTCAEMGEAAGLAAAMCIERKVTPHELASGPLMVELREKLLREDHYIVGARSADSENLAHADEVSVSASSQLTRVAIEEPDLALCLEKDAMVMFPVVSPRIEYVEVLLSVGADTELGWRLHRADGRGLTIPVEPVGEGTVRLSAGDKQWVRIPIALLAERADWHMLELCANADVSWHASRSSLVGLRSLFEEEQRLPWGTNLSSRFSRGWGRPEHCYCARLTEDASLYAPANVVNGHSRPFRQPNLWVSAPTDFARSEHLTVEWPSPRSIRQVMILFDSDLDDKVDALNPNPRAVMASLVKDYDVAVRENGTWTVVCEVRGNHQRRRVHTLDRARATDALRIVVRATNGISRAQIYEVRAYGEPVCVA